MDGRWGRGLWLGLAVVTWACGPGPERTESVPSPPAPEAAVPEVVVPVQKAPECHGEDIVLPTPGDPDALACTEVQLAGDQSEKGRVLRRYDDAGRLLSIDRYRADGVRWSFEHNTYDALGRRVAWETADARERKTLDACGRPVHLESKNVVGEWQVVDLAYDAAGRRTSLVSTTQLWDQEGVSVMHVRFAYDAAGRLVRFEQEQVRGSSRSTMLEERTYDAEGRLVEVARTRTGTGRSPSTETTRHAYDAAGRLVRTEERDASDVRTTDYTYDAAGRLLLEQTTRGRDGGGELERYAYDAQGRKIEAVSGWHQGGVLTTTDEHTQWVYASSGEVTKTVEDRSAGLLVHTYDAQGREIAWATTSGVTGTMTQGRRSFGERGELLREESQWVDGSYRIDQVEQRTYDAARRLVRSERWDAVSDPAWQGPRHSEELWRYDAAGKLASVETWSLDTSPAVLLGGTRYDPVCRDPGE